MRRESDTSSSSEVRRPPDSKTEGSICHVILSQMAMLFNASEVWLLLGKKLFSNLRTKLSVTSK